MKWIIIFLCSIFSCYSFAQQPNRICDVSLLKDGDLLFEVSPSDNAITDVTQGFDGMKIDHVAIYWDKHVIESTRVKGVAISSLEQFIKRNTQDSGEVRVLVGRITSDYHLRKTIKRAKRFLGLPYDSLYLPDNEAVYCSELVLLSFVNKHGKPIFQPVPMTFRDSSGQIPSHWLELYERNGIAVPEGEAGSNPAELSQRKFIKIVGKLP